MRKQKSNEMEDEYKAIGADDYGNVHAKSEVSNERKFGVTEVTEQTPDDVTGTTEHQQQNSGVTMRMSIKNKAIARRRMMSEKQRMDESAVATVAKTSSKR